MTVDRAERLRKCPPLPMLFPLLEFTHLITPLHKTVFVSYRGSLSKLCILFTRTPLFQCFRKPFLGLRVFFSSSHLFCIGLVFLQKIGHIFNNCIPVKVAAFHSGYNVQYLRRILRSGILDGIKIGQM